MNKSMKNKFVAVLTLIFLMFFIIAGFQPIITLADVGERVDTNNTNNTNNTITLHNPLGDRIDNLPAFIYMILGIVFRIGAVLSVLALMYVCFMFVTARGDPAKLETARSAFLYTVIGIAVLLGGVLIASVIQNTIGELAQGVI